MAAAKKKDKAPTITKKELIDRIAENTDSKRVVVKKIIQKFLDAIVDELSSGNRLEFRDFGVFETRIRKPRMAQNPKTLERVPVSEKRTVKFKVGRVMKQRLAEVAKPSAAAVGHSNGREMSGSPLPVGSKPALSRPAAPATAPAAPAKETAGEKQG